MDNLFFGILNTRPSPTFALQLRRQELLQPLGCLVLRGWPATTSTASRRRLEPQRRHPAGTAAGASRQTPMTILQGQPRLAKQVAVSIKTHKLGLGPGGQVRLQTDLPAAYARPSTDAASNMQVHTPRSVVRSLLPWDTGRPAGWLALQQLSLQDLLRQNARALAMCQPKLKAVKVLLALPATVSDEVEDLIKAHAAPPAASRSTSEVPLKPQSDLALGQPKIKGVRVLLALPTPIVDDVNDSKALAAAPTATASHGNIAEAEPLAAVSPPGQPSSQHDREGLVSW